MPMDPTLYLPSTGVQQIAIIDSVNA
jgi:hypothetical protein